jgi:hypothetical protein
MPWLLQAQAHIIGLRQEEGRHHEQGDSLVGQSGAFAVSFQTFAACSLHHFLSTIYV